MLITKVTSSPNKWTFKIAEIKVLLKKYSVGEGWIDPFAGMYSPAEFTNDINEELPTKYHLLAEDFVNLPEFENKEFNGVVFDPPYSYRQISEHYKSVGLKASQLDTSSNFYNRVMNDICDKIKPKGFAISFGWNTNGFGQNRGFWPVEILIVSHGQHHNDTLCLVERKGIFT